MQEQEENQVNPQIETTLQNAGFWRRFFAYILDGFIIGLVGLGIMAITGQLKHPTEINPIGLALALLYYVIMWVNFNGQTIGKKVFGIKVVTVDGKPLSYGKAVLRWLGYYISMIPLYLGFLWIIWDKEKRGWHDKIAGTKVVVIDPRPKTVQAILVIVLNVVLSATLTGIGMLPGFNSSFNININSKTEFRKDFDTSNQLNNVHQGNDRNIEYRIQINPQDEQGNYRNVNYQIEINQTK